MKKTGKNTSITLQKTTLESDDSLLGLSFDAKEYEFYTRTFESTDSIDGVLFQLEIKFNTDIVHNTRQVYSGLDFLGDVGGLYDMLVRIGFWLVTLYSYLFGSSLDKFLI